MCQTSPKRRSVSERKIFEIGPVALLFHLLLALYWSSCELNIEVVCINIG